VVVRDRNQKNEARRVGGRDLPTVGVEAQALPRDLPQAVIEAAKREAGVDSEAELDTALAVMLARPDPVAAYMKRTRGRLGKNHHSSIDV
jgi:hypothetical protein